MGKASLSIAVVASLSLASCASSLSQRVNPNHELSPRVRCAAEQQHIGALQDGYGAASIMTGIPALLSGAILMGAAAADSSNRHEGQSPLMMPAVGTLAFGSVATIVGILLTSAGGDHFDNALQCEDPPQ
jgi:hypothetical protein